MDPEQLLFTTKAGDRADLQDVIYDGLEVDYSDRYPALEQLVTSGAPPHRLYAAAMLASWGVPAGLKMIATWARDPDATPWAKAPVTFEKLGGADAAFELLADAVRVSLDAKSRDDALRTDAMRALLDGYDRIYVGRAVYTALDVDPALRARVRDAIAPAVDRAVAAARDMPSIALQAASLLAHLAALDDEHAARAAETLLGLGGRAVNEVAYSLSYGSGPATLAILERLATTNQIARESLGKRRPS